jgi:hypothetical protein
MAERSFVELGERGLLVVAGEDRRAFLQGLISNDIEKAAPERAIHAALLTAQGKYLHDFFIAAVGDTLLLDGEAVRLADLQRRLSLYKLRARVTLAPAPGDLAVFAAFGDGAPAALALPDEAGAARPYAGGVAFVDPRLAAGSRRATPPPRRCAPTVSPRRISPPTTGCASPTAFPMAAAISRSRRQSCSRPGSTSSTASIGRRAAISARS